MKAASPVVPGRELPEIKLAEHQEQYETLPIVELGEGVVLSRFELNDDEIKFVREHGYLYLYTWTFGRSFQPVRIEAQHPNFPEAKTDAEKM